MNGLDNLINWLEEIQDGKEPKIPYNFHKLVHLFHDNWGTEQAIKVLKSLKEYKDY